MEEARASGGRRRDPSVDDRARAASLELVSERGFEATTMDAVAARSGVSKAALYRRWASKEELIVDAIVATGWNAPPAAVPSTGDLREDLARIIGSETARATAAKARVLNGVLSVISHSSHFRLIITSAIVEPRAVAIRRALQQAVNRGDARAEADLDLLSSLLPAMLVYRLLVEGKPVSRPWQYKIVDQLILPAVS